jgi:energy-coupling factor transporter ATP-binding protein EcfA2
VTTDRDNGALPEALIRLRDALTSLTLGLELPGSDRARRTRNELAAQIDDYLLPRLRQMDAPLLMVVGGSTGAGKSTLVNSLVRATVSRAGVLRPTTRAPVLVCNPADFRWFEDDRILPGLRRSTGEAAPAGELQLVPTERMAPGLALLDAPDIDSVVTENRALATQLLAAADAWLFVTTAARYADAVPWDLLTAARERGTALSVVLNRVPPDAVEEVSGHLRQMLRERSLGDAELLVVRETVLEDGLIPAAELTPVRQRLDALSADAAARSELVRRTLSGALDSLPGRVQIVETAAADQRAAGEDLRAGVESAYEHAIAEVDEAVRSGALLRGEVLARWHDVVGTGDLMRALESRVSWLRDRLRSFATGEPPADAELKAAVETSVDAVVLAAADRAAERAASEWGQLPAGRALLKAAPRLDAVSPELLERTKAEVRSWQGYVFELVRQEGESKRTTARLASLGVNGAGLTVMLAVFVSTGGLTGTEIVIAGGTSALSQKVLEAIFGDQAVRALAARARTDLLERVDRLLDAEAARFLEPLEAAAPSSDDLTRLPDAMRSVEAAR